MQILGIDVGRDSVKVASPPLFEKFKSRVGEYRKLKLASERNYKVEINNEPYFVDELADESYFIREMATKSKIHEETQILFATALGLVADPLQKLAVITGVPIDQHDPETKTKLIQLLHGGYNIAINDQDPRTYDVKEISVAPEGAGAYWDMVLDENGRLKDEELAHQNVKVIDLGSRTINYCTITDQRKYLDRDSGTLNFGMIELSNTEQDQEAYEQFTRKVVASLSKKWLNYNEDKDIVILTGGGTKLIGEILKEHFKKVIVPEDPIFSNSLGDYKMGVAKYGK